MKDKKQLQSAPPNWYSKFKVHPMIASGIFALGVCIGILVYTHHFQNEPATPQSSEFRQGGYTYTNPLLDCDIADGKINEPLIPFRALVQKDVDARIAGGKAENIAVYFRDLNSGPWFGINEREQFIPASLLKIPIAFTYFKKAESDPSLFEKTIQFKKNAEAVKNVSQLIPPVEELVEGNQYTVAQLLEHMILFSDNQALLTLKNGLDAKLAAQIYRQLGVGVSVEQPVGIQLSVKSYATFFRILFNSSFLERDASERLLEMLTRVDFKEGLVAGVPPNIAVAHKFGESRINESQQFHDCGIVYHPKRPYLLCIMSRGSDSPTLIENIKEISRLVYSQVSEQFGSD